MDNKKIKLTIQEIVSDFERLVRYDERLVVHFDFEKADESEIERFHDEMVGMIGKYIPDYARHLDAEYFSGELSTYDRALELYNMLYENFREIFYRLV
ncbi:hypothetical protein [Methanobrevibacter sp.]|uniref:hypothetical protein n=1 Tax=Methanobrevibacter sp. TaxID=66852 RepID=UPI0038650928